MQFYGQLPFLRLLLSFLAGLVLAYHYPEIIDIPVSLLASIALLVLLIHKFLGISYIYRWINGFLLSVFLITFGYYWMDERRTSTNDFENIYGKQKCIILEVNDKTVDRGNFLKFTALVIKIDDSASINNTGRKLLVYLEKDSTPGINYGDILICNARIDEILPPKNPGEFNYRQFTLNQGISGQIWLRPSSWNLLNKNIEKSLLSRVYSLSAYLNEKLTKVFQDKNDLSVARAMLTGDNSNFDTDLRQKYNGVGAMHILCVSGLHVGIIFLLLNSLLSFLNKTKLTRWIKSVALLICIWMYAMITGLSPSVLRATTMFSFIIIGMILHEKPNIYNSLFASAFLLLVIDPYIITSVGFQLSYLAVIAIVSLQPLLYKLITSRFYIIDRAWAIITVSIAAQIGTAPLAIMYFHQFPNYFILTNLLVIPLSALILYSGFTFLVFSGWELGSYIPAKILLYSVKFLNYSTEVIYSLPNPVSDGLYISSEQSILLYGILISVLFFLHFKKKKALFSSLVLIIFLSVVSTTRKWQSLKRREIIEYSVKGHTAVDFISGSRHVFVADSALLRDDKKLNFHIKANWVKLQLNRSKVLIIK